MIPEAYYDWPTDMSPLKRSQKEQKETTMEVLAYQAHLCGDNQNFWSEMNISGHLSWHQQIQLCGGKQAEYLGIIPTTYSKGHPLEIEMN